MNSQPSSVSTRSIVRVGGGAPATTMRVRPGARDGPAPGGGGVEDHGDDGRGAAQQGDAVALDAPQDLGPVDLAQDHLGHAHGGRGVGHPPAVAVEHRQRVQVDVSIGDGGLPAERARVEPQVPVGELHALGAGGGAARVVDGGGGVLVGRLPRLGLDAEAVELVVGRRAELEDVGDVEALGGWAATSASSGSCSSTDAPLCSTM